MTQAEIDAIVEIIAASGDAPGIALREIRDGLDAVAITGDSDASPIHPQLDPADWASLKAFLLSPVTGLPDRIPEVLKVLAQAIKQDNEPRFWRYLWLLLRMSRARLPHMEQEFEQ